jgi:hypothetical protein
MSDTTKPTYKNFWANERKVGEHITLTTDVQGIVLARHAKFATVFGTGRDEPEALAALCDSFAALAVLLNDIVTRPSVTVGGSPPVAAVFAGTGMTYCFPDAKVPRADA